MSKLFELERYKKFVAGAALSYMTGRLWTATRSLFHSGYIVGAIRSEAVGGKYKGEVGWYRIEDYRECDLSREARRPNADTPSDDQNTYYGLITRRGIEALYRNGRLTFSQGIDVWEEREHVRALYAAEHPDEYLVVSKPDDSAGTPDCIYPPEVRWAVERCL